MKLGIDVGGTHTDAVLVRRDGRLVAWSKQLTTDDIVTGITTVTKKVLDEANINPLDIKGVFLGTTHVLNAIYHQQDLEETILVRITHQPSRIKAGIGWPPHLKPYIKAVYHVQSQYDYTGKRCDNNEACEKSIEKLVDALHAYRPKALCIVGAFSPMYEQEEQELKERVQAIFPNMSITVSHKIGTIGFIQRENTALLNAMLSRVLPRAMRDLEHRFLSFGIKCPIWLTQNDGSLIEVNEALEYPILTIGSGVTNSMRGASILSDRDDLIVVDVGGNTIDIGRIRNGHPVDQLFPSDFFDIDVNMRLPHMMSLAYGGGSVIVKDHEGVRITDRVINRLEGQALAWGGNTFTLTDAFLRLNPGCLINENIQPGFLMNIEPPECDQLTRKVVGEIKQVISYYQSESEDLPVVVVGGGSPLLFKWLSSKYQKVIHPAGYPICNAVGACFAPLGACADKVFWLQDKSKERIVQELKETLINELLMKGALPESIRLVSIEEYPFAYLSGEVLRIRVRVIGELE